MQHGVGQCLAYNTVMIDDDSPIFCSRCVCELTPGRGNLYVVYIEAVADPTPPVFTDKDLSRNTTAELNQLVQQMRDLSPREGMDQVRRRVTIHLCSACYVEWIENPTAS